MRRSAFSGDPPVGLAGLLHAVLLPTVPVLALWSGNVRRVVTLFPLRIALVMAVLGLLLTGLATIAQRDVRRSALVTTGLLVGGSAYGYAFGPEESLGLASGLVAAVVLVVISVRLPGWLLRAVTVILNVTAVALVTANGTVILLQRPTAGDVPRLEATAHATPTARDVWYIVPDRYASLALLEDRGVNTRGFAAHLRNLGFSVLDDAQADYMGTPSSLASAWNAQSLEALREEDSFGDAAALLQDPLVGRLFRDAGYTYHHVGSWFDQTASSDSASVVHTLQGGQEFYNAFESMTVLPSLRARLPLGGYVVPITERHVQHALHQFSVLDHLAQRDPDQPEFVLAHVVLPHGPYLFRADGSVRAQPPPARQAKRGYEEQLAFLNARLSDLVAQLQARDDPPFILILADEGVHPHTLGPTSGTSSSLTPSQIEAKRSIMAAVYDPTGTTLAHSDLTSPIDLVRTMLNTVLHTRLHPHAGRP